MLNQLYTIPADMKIVKQLESATGEYRQIELSVLLMGGTKSQSFFQQSVAFLAGSLPHSQTKIFEGFDHYSPEEKIDEVSAALKQFFDGEDAKI